MKTTVNEYDFINAFKQYGREDNFSYEGLKALFQYLESYEEDTDSEIELDVIALCCDYTEYENFEELQSNYDNIQDMDDLLDHTTVIEIDGSDGFIIQNF